MHRSGRVPVVALTLLLAACGSGGAAPSRVTASPVVARVGSSVITLAAFDTRLVSATTSVEQGGGPSGDPAMESQLRASVLRSLILDTVIAQEAEAHGLAVTSAEVQRQVAADAAAAGGMTNLQTQLSEAGGSLAQLEDEIRSQQNEQRLEDWFARQRAAQAEAELAAGMSFASVAAQLSDDENTSGKGGDLGALSATALAADDSAFASAVRSLRVGAYTTTPVHDQGGYDIIEVYARMASTWSVRHILIAAPTPYTVTSRPAWFTEALFAAVAQDCRAGDIHVYIGNVGGNPCSGAPSLGTAAASSPSP